MLIDDGLMYYRGLLYVPYSDANDTLRTDLVRAYYNTAISRHLGKNKTFALLLRAYF